jgi:hypothetical protein
MASVKRWVRFIAMVGLLTVGLAYVGVAPIFGVLIAIMVASLIEQLLTQTPGRLLRALPDRRDVAR